MAGGDIADREAGLGFVDADRELAVLLADGGAQVAQLRQPATNRMGAVAGDEFPHQPGPVTVVFLERCRRHREPLPPVKRREMFAVGQQRGVDQRMAVAHDPSALPAIGKIYHNVRGDFGPAGQNWSVAPLQFHLAQATDALAAARQLQVEDARANRCLMNQRSLGHLGHDIAGLEADRWHRLTARLAPS